mmetsp:Transcript_9845/g.30388  ORF Transcript_9845/g.30388 Transcript_9845/m.30388 type:complete len:257 (-) Transcript_9845:300-1070(-)
MRSHGFCTSVGCSSALSSTSNMSRLRRTLSLYDVSEPLSCGSMPISAARRSITGTLVSCAMANHWNGCVTFRWSWHVHCGSTERLRLATARRYRALPAPMLISPSRPRFHRLFADHWKARRNARRFASPDGIAVGVKASGMLLQPGSFDALKLESATSGDESSWRSWNACEARWVVRVDAATFDLARAMKSSPRFSSKPGSAPQSPYSSASSKTSSWLSAGSSIDGLAAMAAVMLATVSSVAFVVGGEKAAMISST